MYKINEAADLLKVTRVEIFEKLLSQRELFHPYIEKINGVTWISDAGIAKLREMLFGEVPSHQVNGVQETAQNQVGQTSKAQVNAFKAVENTQMDQRQNSQPTNRESGRTKFYAGEALVHNKDDLLRLRQRIRQLRNQILTSDSELKRKEDAIAHYQQILKDDLEWIKNLEKQLTGAISLMDDPFPLAPDFEMPGEEKPGIKKFFKR